MQSGPAADMHSSFAYSQARRDKLHSFGMKLQDYVVGAELRRGQSRTL